MVYRLIFRYLFLEVTLPVTVNSLVPFVIKLLSSWNGHVEIAAAGAVANPDADGGEKGDGQPEQEEQLQVEVAVLVGYRPGRHDDQRGSQVLNGLQKSIGKNRVAGAARNWGFWMDRSRFFLPAPKISKMGYNGNLTKAKFKKKIIPVTLRERSCRYLYNFFYLWRQPTCIRP